jgi:nucleoside-diphosphate-sugar epimerase
MAFARFMRLISEQDEVQVFGDGEQTREFTFVSDAIDGTIKAATADVVGKVINLGGGSRASINHVLDSLENISGMTVERRNLPSAPGDPRHTGASIDLARERLHWEPRVTLLEGLRKQWQWFTETLNAG